MLGKIVLVGKPQKPDRNIGIVVDEHLGANGIECFSVIDKLRFYVLLQDILDLEKHSLTASKSHGAICWYKEDLEGYTPNERFPHRDDDLPALMYLDGHKEWWYRGFRHREGDKPAVIYPDGSEEYYRYGSLHRIDLPARITTTEIEYWENGKMIKRMERK